LVAIATSLEILDKEVQIDHLYPKLLFGEKTAKTGPVNPDIIVLLAIVKTRNAWQSLEYSLLGAVMSPSTEYF